jgi:AraC-like DNA-binding protein
LADRLLQRFSSYRVSTRQLLIDRNCPNERNALIEAGKRLDQETDGSWVRDGIARYVASHKDKDIILVDAVRTERQISHLRETYGTRCVHIHVTAPFEVAKERYQNRGSIADRGMTYDQVRADPTESEVWALEKIADRVVVNHNQEPESLLALAAAGLADRLRVTTRTLNRRFKAATGETPLEFLQKARIERARGLLETSRLSFDQIVERVGYEDASSFRRLFKRAVGISPHEYRRRFSIHSV